MMTSQPHQTTLLPQHFHPWCGPPRCHTGPPQDHYLNPSSLDSWEHFPGIQNPGDSHFAHCRHHRPPHGLPSHPTPPASALALTVTEAAFQHVPECYPHGSAPSRSHWTYEHIRVAIGTSPTATTTVFELMNLLHKDLPSLTSPLLQPSALIALRNLGQGVQPIHLTSLCAMAACLDVCLSLAPLQLRVGVPGGSQCAGHELWSGLSCCPGDETLQLDVQDTFNSVSLQALLQAMAILTPRLLPFTAWNYRIDSLLQRGTKD
jgi:hypothetical protein